jgi:hypothetical protein
MASIEKMLADLGARISHCTKVGQFQGLGGALDCEESRLSLIVGLASENQPRSTVGAYSAASSTYYAASGNAWAHFLTTPWNLWWLIRTVWYLRVKSWRMSNKMVKFAGGIENLTADELDIRASIARKCRWHIEAMRCVNLALARADISDNTRVLLLIHRTKDWEMGGEAGKVASVFQEIEEIVGKGNVPVMTQVRALRAWARWLKATGAPEVQVKIMLDGATKLAEKAGLGDQVVKVQARM